MQAWAARRRQSQIEPVPFTIRFDGSKEMASQLAKHRLGVIQATTLEGEFQRRPSDSRYLSIGQER